MKLVPLDLVERIDQLTVVVNAQQRQLNALASQIAQVPHPPRPGWFRTNTVTLDELPTIELDSVRHLIPPKITRITIDDSPSMIVTAYAGEQPVPQFCGPFRDVGRRLLQISGGLKWIKIPAPSVAS